MKKKDPVLWVVVYKANRVRLFAWRSRRRAEKDVRFCSRCFPSFGPYSVVKYVPAPKPKKRKKAK